MDEENFSEEALVVEPETTEEATLETPEVNAELEAEREARAKAEELAQNYKIRAEKAEKKAKETETTTPKVENVTESKDGLSSRDTIAIINAKVHEDDIDEVVEYAKFKKISIQEALKSNIVKASLAEKAEHRETAETTSTGRVRSGNASRTGESMLSKAREKGEMPDSGADLDKMLDARFAK